MRLPILCLLLTGFGLFTAGAGPCAAEEQPPPGVEQILPRGGIPAVLDPRYVTADEAGIPDEAWVLGVIVDGNARAYSLNLLNRHEIVNDQVGKTMFAAVW